MGDKCACCTVPPIGSANANDCFLPLSFKSLQLKWDILSWIGRFSWITSVQPQFMSILFSIKRNLLFGLKLVQCLAFKISLRWTQIHIKLLVLPAVFCSEVPPCALSAAVDGSNKQCVGEPEIAPATVFNRLTLISLEQMDFLHVKCTITVQCHWCVPRSDVALYWVCNYSQLNNTSVTKQGHLEQENFWNTLRLKQWIYNDILRMTGNTRRNFQVGLTLCVSF